MVGCAKFFAILHNYAVVSTVEVDVYGSSGYIFYESVECCLVEFLFAIMRHNAVPHIEAELLSCAVGENNPSVGILYQHPKAVSFLLNRKALI